jgi:5'-deoxynucleotidase YfbR-like HD superfamily hydrolase
MLTVQSVGEHSARVATLYVEIFGLPRAEVLYHILHHDSGELNAGDPPFPVKQKHPHYKRGHSDAEKDGLALLDVELPDLADWELRRVKVADLMEMWETGRHEMRLGNSYAQPIVDDTVDAASKVASDEDFRKLQDWITKQEETCGHMT